MTEPVTKIDYKNYWRDYYNDNRNKIKEYYKKRYWNKSLYGKIKNKENNIFKINKNSFTINFD